MGTSRDGCLPHVVPGTWGQCPAHGRGSHRSVYTGPAEREVKKKNRGCITRFNASRAQPDYGSMGRPCKVVQVACIGLTTTLCSLDTQRGIVRWRDCFFFSSIMSMLLLLFVTHTCRILTLFYPAPDPR